MSESFRLLLHVLLSQAVRQAAVVKRLRITYCCISRSQRLQERDLRPSMQGELSAPE